MDMNRFPAYLVSVFVITYDDMSVLFLSADEISFLIPAAPVMDMFFHAAYDTAIPVNALDCMFMPFLCADQHLPRTAFIMSMLFHSADRLCLPRFVSPIGQNSLSGIIGRRRRLFRFRRIRTRQIFFTVRSILCRSFLTDQNLLRHVAFLGMLMNRMLLQRAGQAAVRIIAAVVMRMDHVIGITADRFCTRIALLVRLITFIGMLMHFVLAVQHFHLMRHRLTVKLQCRQRAVCYYHCQTQKYDQPAPVLLLFL